MIKLLHRLGFEWRKPTGLPARADVAAQEAFVAAYERLLNGLAPDETVYSPTRCIPSTRAGPPMAGSARASIWRSGAARAACE